MPILEAVPVLYPAVVHVRFHTHPGLQKVSGPVSLFLTVLLWGAFFPGGFFWGVERTALAAAPRGTSSTPSDSSAGEIWDMKKLGRPPQARWGKKEGKVQEVYFAGESYRGKPTTVFAYVGRPEGEGPFPGIVLVHGGGGRAFQKWAAHWAERGYVSIAMDTAGNGPGKKRLPDGGPDQSHAFKFMEFTEKETRNLWTYHAVSEVILAHSLLRSLPEVQPDKTAITGISWGGYLTCIVAGVDDRFQAAVPVYGCGFLNDNSAWSDSDLKKLSSSSRRLWIRKFDPGQHVGRTRCPILFLNGTNDFAYPLDSYRKTIEQVSPEWVTTSIQLNLPHGHIWTFGIVDRFVDWKLRNGPPLVRLGEIRQQKKRATARILSEQPVKKAEVLFTFDQGPWQKRKWETLPARIEGNQVSFELEFDRPAEYFFQLTDQGGFKTSTTHERFQPGLGLENHASLPVPRLEKDFYDWYRRHADVLRIKDTLNPQYILLGDSITHMWGGEPTQKERRRGEDSWRELFGEGGLNLGFGWDRTQNALWRIEHGELDGLSPKVVVINIGTNNFTATRNHPACSPVQVAEGVDRICQRVMEKLPAARVILMGIFPRGEKAGTPVREKISSTNGLLRDLAEKRKITFLDISDSLLEENGRLPPEVANDYLHPTARGYRTWAAQLKPHLIPPN